jgi:hypothetical protein
MCAATCRLKRGHPDLNEITVRQFPYPKQISRSRENAERYPDLRPVPHGVGTRTLAGTRAAICTVNRNGYPNGKGASPLDGDSAPAINLINRR